MALSNPFMIAIMLVPFVPAMILNRKARQIESNLVEIIDQTDLEPKEKFKVKDFDFDFDE